MKRNKLPVMFLLPMAAVIIMGLLLCGPAEGAAVVIETSMVTYVPTEPMHTDTFNVTVEPVLVDAEPVEDGVVLMWSLCTEDGCGIAQPEVMTDNGDGTWSATIGPFDEKHPVTGKVHQDILFRIKITATPTTGGDEIVEESGALTVYFKEGSPVDDDDDPDDSPFGMEMVLLGMIIAAGYVAFRKKD
ncbi:MAG: hypothetical protein JXA22_06825 [Candidatus Thermoplasmatota archaeon]|nr:hypothetical protein [Candidatus Thermoplasmatota archaeon]